MTKFGHSLLWIKLALIPFYAAAQQAETVWIPMQISVNSSPIRLEATLYRPTGITPVPVVVFPHGSSGGPIPPSYTEQAFGLASFLNKLGVALLVPMRSGRGKSEGVNNEEPSACTSTSTEAGLQNASTAVDATLSWLGTQQWSDMSRIVMAGHSRGGILSVTYAAQHPGVVLGSINFSGGWKSDHCGEVDVNAAVFSAAGKKTPRVRSLFLYARGDGFYSDESMENYARAFKNSGGDVVFRIYAFNDANGHLLFRRKQVLWEPDVDTFIKQIGLISTSPAVPTQPKP